MNSIKLKKSISKVNGLLWLIPLLIISGVYYIGALLLGFDTFCVFKNSTGMPCPGCGMTRAVLCVGQGQFENAFFWHPLWPLVTVGIGIFGYWILFKCGVVKSFGLFYKLFESNWLWLSVLILFIIVYMLRMFLYFPMQKPLDYETDNLLFNMIELFKVIF